MEVEMWVFLAVDCDQNESCSQTRREVANISNFQHQLRSLMLIICVPLDIAYLVFAHYKVVTQLPRACSVATDNCKIYGNFKAILPVVNSHNLNSKNKKKSY